MKRQNNILLNLFIILVGFAVFISCSKDEEKPEDDSLKDIDGNSYKTVKISDQTWMAENLEVTKFNDGTKIPNIKEDSEWKDISTPGYCWNENDISNKDKYGALYNWYTVETGKLCPTGWHVPTDGDMQKLLLNLGINSQEFEKIGWIGTEEGKLLKAKTGWHADGNGTDDYNLSLIAGGLRHYNDTYFDYETENGYLWTSTEKSDNTAWRIALFFNHDNVDRNASHKNYGMSVRCIKD